MTELPGPSPTSQSRPARRVTVISATGRPARRDQWHWAFLLIGITCLAYLPALRAGYVWDDSDHVTQFPIQRTVKALASVWIRPGATPQYYPLTHTVFWLQYYAWGTRPLGYHLLNIALHACSALLLWRLLRTLGIRGAWLAAAIFAVHPVHVESVAWVTELKNTLSGVFYLLAMTCAVHIWDLHAAPSTVRKSKPAPRGAMGMYLLFLLCFVAAVLSKTVTCTLPAAIAVLIGWKRGRIAAREMLMLVPPVMIALLVAQLTRAMEQWNVGATGRDFALSGRQRLLIAGRAIWFYAGKLLWPANLAFIYPRWDVDPRAAWQWTFPVVTAVVVIALWLLRRRLGRGPLAAVLLFIGTLFPALGFFDIYPMRFSFVADHFQYLASMALIVLAVQGLIKIPLPPSLQRVAAAVVLLALGAAAFRQTLAYHNEVTLWFDTLEKNPNCWLAMDNLGSIASGRGDDIEAMRWYDRSLSVHPEQAEAHLLRGNSFALREQPYDAVAEYKAAIAIDPADTRNVASAHHAIAKVFAERGDLPAAVPEYEQVLAAAPRREQARVELATVLQKLHRLSEARAHYQTLLTLNPDSVMGHLGYAELLLREGNSNDAMKEIEDATRLNPDPRVQLAAGTLLLQAHRLDEAAERFTRVIAADPTIAEAYDNIGVTFAIRGNSEQAAMQFRKALAIDPNFAAARKHLDDLDTPRR